MPKFLDALTPELTELIEQQPLFFVATAPLSSEGRVNLSPKGLDTFRVLSPNRVAYLDLTGSGNETAAHLRENGRVTFMFCSFGPKPLILRLYGQGRVVLPGEEEWDDLVPHFEAFHGTRQIIVAEVELVQTSCGYGVPRMEPKGDRKTLQGYLDAKTEDELKAYRQEKNARSLDGLAIPLRD
jgi:hypothetical protein